ncbi:MAG: ParB/RepB/Spo0J family partition protein [Xanthomonadales bacterium]|nr:ParB/RepB/Spo0J family partition protein [Xanthomonadales bacterium]
MAARKRGLGKGLDALLGSASDDRPRGSKTGDGDLREIPIEAIQPGRYQPRTGMDPGKLDELADSIRAQGVVQPIVVRAISSDMFEIIAGERRWRAAQLAELRTIPAVVRELSDQQTVAVALIENIQRENLNPLEESGALRRLIEEFDLTHAEAARAVGRSRAAVTNLLRLQELEAPNKALIEAGKLEMGHARALLALQGQDQIDAGKRVAARGLSVRETEKLVRRLQSTEERKPPPTPSRIDPDIRRLQDDLAERLCAQVNIQHKNSGKGQLVISYNSLDELDGILEKIN